jgi:alanine-synthesizing transaminase
MRPFPRVPPALAPNRLTLAVRRAGRVAYDLTVTNPTAVGLDYPDDILAPLGSPAGRHYRPTALGLPAARAAVAADYRRRGHAVEPEHVVLTASTSDAYSLLFKLLCRPDGDRVLVPAPSYPLFDHLTRLDGVGVDQYALEYHGRWSLDAVSIDERWTPATRAVLAVTPNNPTGSVLSAAELAALDARCARDGAALILDEVFADFPLADAGSSAAPTGPPSALTFRLGGLSKSAGLPQVKLGWIAVGGPADETARALDALDLLCDTYLAVSTPVQEAAAALIDAGAYVRRQILDRIRRNDAALRTAVAAMPALGVLHADAGWSAVVRVPATRPEEDIVIDLLEHAGVLVHPGFFFDFPHEAFLVLSLLPDPKTFDAGVARLLERVDA